jgi:hypothetical protein
MKSLGSFRLYSRADFPHKTLKIYCFFYVNNVYFSKISIIFIINYEEYILLLDY